MYILDERSRMRCVASQIARDHTHGGRTHVRDRSAWCNGLYWQINRRAHSTALTDKSEMGNCWKIGRQAPKASSKFERDCFQSITAWYIIPTLPTPLKLSKTRGTVLISFRDGSCPASSGGHRQSCQEIQSLHQYCWSILMVWRDRD